MPKPIAALISDIHYSLPTLELADAAMRQAIAKANALKIPLIVAGDLHDTKANLRAECVNTMLKTFKKAKDCVVIRGNHDSLNERSSEHALNFLPNNVTLIAGHPYTKKTNGTDLICIPYYHDPEELRKVLKTIPKGSTLIMHQGLQGSNSGDYIQDKSAITHDDVKDLRVISGHYHTRQDIKTGPPRKGAVGLWSYLGNPYTMNFGEANDPEKGYNILMDDGLLEFVPTNLRSHVVITREPGHGRYTSHPEPGDIVLVRCKGTKEWLATRTRETLLKEIGIPDLAFKLELIPTDNQPRLAPAIQKPRTNPEHLDSLIQSMDLTPECKDRLQQMWRQFCE